MASLGLRSAVQPLLRPLSCDSAGGLCPAKSGGARRSAGPGCYLLHFCRKLFLLVRVGGQGEGARTGAFCLQQSPESWIPWRGFSPPSGFPCCRREPFQELLWARLGSGAPAARPPQLAPPRSRSRMGSAAPVQQLGEHAGCVRKGPESASKEQTGRKFVLPTLCPRGRRRRKRRQRREDRPRQGEEETLSGSTSGQPEPGMPSATLWEVWAARRPPAFCRKFGEHKVACRRP
ncbi:uncharacterized protein LOC108303284 isoform X2 [Cebus imitator]|uniref:uncharacterized protein LOC108303284 isoform X2 n=1 Tax=Cebus imitator TaxID=2715852 RepID=UPI00080A08E1|nr:uncharacterized protein LOC108303284 isoform X2 [Cebus imitator]